MDISSRETLWSRLGIIWTIAAKDIVDGLKSKLVIALVVTSSLVLLLPKLLPYIFDQPLTVLPVYDPDSSSLVATLQADPNLTVQPVHSEQEFRQALCSGLYPEIGLQLPPDSDKLLAGTGPVKLQGYVCWSRRFQVGEVLPRLEAQLSKVLGREISIDIQGNIIYPPADAGLLPGLATINSVVMLLMMGIVLVPNLMFDEKENKTLQALLVSPASIGQVVIGKALAGFFYVLVVTPVLFVISWADVVHWGAAAIFVFCGGVFSVGVGLVLGSFFDRQQDAVGWTMLVLVLCIGAILVKVFGVNLPAILERILSWVPTVAIAEVCRAAFSEVVSAARLWANLGILLVVTLPLYGLVIWKVRRSDR